jgi:hypothetical protein
MSGLQRREHKSIGGVQQWKIAGGFLHYSIPIAIPTLMDWDTGGE